jgi:plasmid stability protein
MSTMIQIRNVPDALHRKIKARAALQGQTMSDYILAELRRVVERPTREELLARLAALPPIELEPDAATLVREERDRR